MEKKKKKKARRPGPFPVPFDAAAASCRHQHTSAATNMCKTHPQPRISCTAGAWDCGGVFILPDFQWMNFLTHFLL